MAVAALAVSPGLLDWNAVPAPAPAGRLQVPPPDPTPTDSLPGGLRAPETHGKTAPGP